MEIIGCALARGLLLICLVLTLPDVDRRRTHTYSISFYLCFGPLLIHPLPNPP